MPGPGQNRSALLHSFFVAVSAQNHFNYFEAVGTHKVPGWCGHMRYHREGHRAVAECRAMKLYTHNGME